MPQHAQDLLESRFPAQSGDRNQIVMRASSGLFGLGTGAALIGLAIHVMDMTDVSLELAAMIGLGVGIGINYSLFVLTH